MIYSFFSDSSPACLPDLLTMYTPSRQLCSSAEIQILHIPYLRTKTFWPVLIYCVPKERNFLPSDIHYIQSSQALKIALINCLYKQHKKWLQVLSSSFAPPPLLPLTFLLCTSVWCIFVCMHVCVCVCTWGGGVHGILCLQIIFEGFFLDTFLLIL